MKAHQEEKNILNPPPSKHYEWSFLYCLIRRKPASLPSGCQLLSLHWQCALGRGRQLLTGAVPAEVWTGTTTNIFLQQPNHNLQEQVKLQAPGVTAVTGTAIQVMEHRGSNPILPQHAASPAPAWGFFLVSTVRRVTSPKHKAGRRDRVCRGQHPLTLNTSECSQHCGTDLCRCLWWHRATLELGHIWTPACLEQAHPCLYCWPEPSVCQHTVPYNFQYCDWPAVIDTILLIRAIFSSAMYCPFPLLFPRTTPFWHM